MTSTGLELITDALLEIGAVAEGETPNGDLSAFALVRLQKLVDRWQAERFLIYTLVRATYPLVANQQTYTIGQSGSPDFSQARPMWIEKAGLIDTGPSPDIEIPLEILSDYEYAAIGIKALTSTYPTGLYNDQAYPNSSLFFWPCPTLTTLQVALYTPDPVLGYADFTTSYAFPPGYQEAFLYQLAIRLAAAMGRELSAETKELARESLAVVKRANIHVQSLTLDPAVQGLRGGYNWRTDEPR